MHSGTEGRILDYRAKVLHSEGPWCPSGTNLQACTSFCCISEASQESVRMKHQCHQETVEAPTLSSLPLAHGQWPLADPDNRVCAWLACVWMSHSPTWQALPNVLCCCTSLHGTPPLPHVIPCCKSLRGKRPASCPLKRCYTIAFASCGNCMIFPPAPGSMRLLMTIQSQVSRREGHTGREHSVTLYVCFARALLCSSLGIKLLVQDFLRQACTGIQDTYESQKSGIT